MFALATPVGGARAEGAEATGKIAGQTPVHLSHERSALFMPAEHEADLLGALERYHEVCILFSGSTEDVLDAFKLQALHQQVRRFHLRGLRGLRALVVRVPRQQK